MGTEAELSPQAWAEHTFGEVDLQDQRRTQRAVTMATGMMRNPGASLPQQMGSHKALKAAYRLLQEEDGSHRALMTPHFEQTREAACTQEVVLMVQDTTQMDYTHHRGKKGMGPIGTGQGRGFLLQTVLAVVPHPRQVLGIAYQEPFLRQEAPQPPEDCKQRQRRPRESQVWARAVEQVGAPSTSSQWVHVGDRYSEIFEFLETCRAQHTHFLIRAAQNRRIRDPEGRGMYLFSFARALPSVGEKVLDLPARHGQPARQAHVLLSFAPLTLQPPLHSPQHSPLRVWVIRVWEPDPPADLDHPLEWVLLTSVETTDLTQAWERVYWYTCRWIVEDYHQCLKTGCRLEQRHLQDGERLFRLLGFLAPVAVRLLALREAVRLNPHQPAWDVLPQETVQVVATLADVPVDVLTVEVFWRRVAGWGGYLGRRGDGPPGWKTLWRGWLYVQTLVEGVHLAARWPPPKKCG